MKRSDKKPRRPHVYERWMRKHGNALACYLSWDESELSRMRKLIKCENECREKGEPKVTLVRVRIQEFK